jgi:hypothetical protein
MKVLNTRMLGCIFEELRRRYHEWHCGSEESVEVRLFLTAFDIPASMKISVLGWRHTNHHACSYCDATLEAIRTGRA